jgi:hypothetical protein
LGKRDAMICTMNKKWFMDSKFVLT